MMIHEREDRGIQRIIVAADASPASLVALRAAVELAARLEASLEGVFVEDINLLRIGELPFNIEVGVFSARLRRLNRKLVARQLRAQANLVRKTLARNAQAHKLEWTFRIRRGAIDQLLLEAADEADLIVVGRSGWSRQLRRVGSTARALVGHSKRPALVLENHMQPDATILILDDNSALARRTFETAASLAQIQHARLMIAILADDEVEAQARQAEIETWLQGLDLVYVFHMLINADRRHVQQMVSFLGRCLLVIPGSLRDIQAEKLIDELDCPMLLVR